jgi:hypothetical protein
MHLPLYTFVQNFRLLPASGLRGAANIRPPLLRLRILAAPLPARLLARQMLVMALALN